MPVRIQLAESAREDLADVLEWYDSQDAPHVGMRLVTEIADRIRQLAMLPDSGKIVPEFDIPHLRELEMPPFRIVYRRDPDSVVVVRIWRSERLMDPDLPENA